MLRDRDYAYLYRKYKRRYLRGGSVGSSKAQRKAEIRAAQARLRATTSPHPETEAIPSLMKEPKKALARLREAQDRLREAQDRLREAKGSETASRTEPTPDTGELSPEEFCHKLHVHMAEQKDKLGDDPVFQGQQEVLEHMVTDANAHELLGIDEEADIDNAIKSYKSFHDIEGPHDFDTHEQSLISRSANDRALSFLCESSFKNPRAPAPRTQAPRTQALRAAPEAGVLSPKDFCQKLHDHMKEQAKVKALLHERNWLMQRINPNDVYIYLNIQPGTAIEDIIEMYQRNNPGFSTNERGDMEKRGNELFLSYLCDPDFKSKLDLHYKKALDANKRATERKRPPAAPAVKSKPISSSACGCKTQKGVSCKLKPRSGARFCHIHTKKCNNPI